MHRSSAWTREWLEGGSGHTKSRLYQICGGVGNVRCLLKCIFIACELMIFAYFFPHHICFGSAYCQTQGFVL